MSARDQASLHVAMRAGAVCAVYARPPKAGPRAEFLQEHSVRVAWLCVDSHLWFGVESPGSSWIWSLPTATPLPYVRME
eukprot:4912754-Amphidinium_carterae.1